MGKTKSGEIVNYIKSFGNVDEYTINGGKTVVYRTFGTINFFDLICQKWGLSWEWTAAGLSATASGEGFSVDYCERDILVAVGK